MSWWVARVSPIDSQAGAASLKLILPYPLLSCTTNIFSGKEIFQLLKSCHSVYRQKMSSNLLTNGYIIDVTQYGFIIVIASLVLSALKTLVIIKVLKLTIYSKNLCLVDCIEELWVGVILHQTTFGDPIHVISVRFSHLEPPSSCVQIVNSPIFSYE